MALHADCQLSADSEEFTRGPLVLEWRASSLNVLTHDTFQEL
jgi:hypothetical protein